MRSFLCISKTIYRKVNAHFTKMFTRRSLFEHDNSFLDRFFLMGVSHICICFYFNCIGLEEVMRTSRDYLELFQVWRDWRDITGAPTRNDYREYVMLSNDVAMANGEEQNKYYCIIFYDSYFRGITEFLTLR